MLTNLVRPKSGKGGPLDLLTRERSIRRGPNYRQLHTSQCEGALTPDGATRIGASAIFAERAARVHLSFTNKQHSPLVRRATSASSARKSSALPTRVAGPRGGGFCSPSLYARARQMTQYAQCTARFGAFRLSCASRVWVRRYITSHPAHHCTTFRA